MFFLDVCHYDIQRGKRTQNKEETHFPKDIACLFGCFCLHFVVGLLFGFLLWFLSYFLLRRNPETLTRSYVGKSSIENLEYFSLFKQVLSRGILGVQITTFGAKLLLAKLLFSRFFYFGNIIGLYPVSLKWQKHGVLLHVFSK